MRFQPSEPDISTIYNRLVDGDIDLQPDFQRGDVWSLQKRQKLVDTILRGWIVPPVIIIAQNNGGPQLVLDGQQRLAAIRDFKENKFRVDGHIEPLSYEVEKLDRLYYSQLPNDVRKFFDKAVIRIFEVTDYRPEEPAEIFFRLNQPMPLTSAEKRNAYIGPVRDQIRKLVDECKADDKLGQILGFSNARMAYDDVLARMACVMEQGTLWQKITAGAVNSMYRRSSEIEDVKYTRMSMALKRLSSIAAEVRRVPGTGGELKLNKATFLSWLLFLSRISSFEKPNMLAAFFEYFELLKSGDSKISPPSFGKDDGELYWPDALVPVVLVYSDRATSRVTDVASLVLRDIALWISWHEFSKDPDIECTDPAYRYIGKYRSAVFGGEYELHTSIGFPEFSDEKLLSFASSINWAREF
ncbi:DUF262 domain-containing protein [Dokdonella sp. MW10]|uniref:DUF262 domain-containing protein n=1 Tax=Dokdonella sp. MW10 TaxID=2992926 RepID=UPI003F80FC04